MTKQNTMRMLTLLLASVFLMIAIYFLQKWQVNTSRTLIPAPSPSSSAQQPSPTPVQTPTPEERAVLNIPLSYESQTKKTEHAQAVIKLVKTTPALDITSCIPNPTVYQIPLNGSFTINNNDAIPRTLRYMSSHITVPSNGSITITTSTLFTIAGNYGYGCDNPFAKHGVLMVR